MYAAKEHPYPIGFEGFLNWFSTEEDCLDCLARIRWGDGKDGALA